jgi:hypothetical protein
MQVIKIPDMMSIFDHIVIGEHEVPMCIGQFGCGKTAGVGAWINKRRYVLCKVLLGQYDTVDLKGSPWVDTLEGDEIPTTVWRPASTLPFEGVNRFQRVDPETGEPVPIILFLDELTSATIPVMAVCYQLINEFRIGEHKLADNVYIICAGNRDIDKGVVTRMPKPLENRMTWFEISHDLETWSAWASRTYGKDAAMAIAFLNWKREYLCTYDPSKPERVVATPRTWEKAIKYDRRASMPDYLKEAAISGAIGQGVCAEYWSFKTIYHEISELIPKIRKDPGKAPIPDEPSKMYAVTVACSGNMSMKDKAGLSAFAIYLMRLSPEFTTLGWQLAVNRDESLFDADEFVKFSIKYNALFDK